jgi:transitional endoplasmic reticulum ATPase
LQKNAPKLIAPEATLVSVAKRWNGYSVKRILSVTEELPSYVADEREKGKLIANLTYDDFMSALRRIQGSKGVSPEDVKSMDELVLPQKTKTAITMIAGRLKDPERVERLGGTLPTGVLFHGPAGTGKTTVAKSLAKEVGAAFLVSTGADMARDPKEVDRVFSKAKELRPAIIFIDEADDLLRSREYSNNTESTNKLLTLMDGVNDRVKDVLWIAATNHPDQIDPALMRAGRFTEKVEFVRPSGEQLVAHITTWLNKRGVALVPGFTVVQIAALMGEQSIANAEGILQYAVNTAIAATSSDTVVLDATDIESGIRTILG